MSNNRPLFRSLMLCILAACLLSACATNGRRGCRLSIGNALAEPISLCSGYDASGCQGRDTIDPGAIKKIPLIVNDDVAHADSREKEDANYEAFGNLLVEVCGNVVQLKTIRTKAQYIEHGNGVDYGVVIDKAARDMACSAPAFPQ